MKTLIIGGVAAGMSCASKLRRLDPNREIIVYERGHDLSYGACGMPYYLSDIIEDEKSLVARFKEEFEESGIKVMTGHEVTHLDAQHKTIEGQKEDGSLFKDSYDQILIATGASGIHLDIKNHHLKGIYPLTSLQHAITLKKELQKVQTVVIIGAGYIGIEVAENLIEMGKTVHLIQRSNQVLSSYDKMYADMAEAALIKAGVMIHKEETVIGYTGEDHVQSVLTQTHEYPADCVIESVGVKPNTNFLKGSGLKMLDNGAIIVNDKGETSLTDVYAAGDCVAYPHLLLKTPQFIPLGTHANKLGRVVAERLAGDQNAHFKGVLGSNIIKVMDLTVTQTGLSMNDHARHPELNLDYVDIKAKDHAGYYPGAETIYLRLVYDQTTHVIKGAQMVGKKGVADRINILATIIDQGLTADQVSMLDFAYAPPFQPVWDPIHIAALQIK